AVGPKRCRSYPARVLRSLLRSLTISAGVPGQPRRKPTKREAGRDYIDETYQSHITYRRLLEQSVSMCARRSDERELFQALQLVDHPLDHAQPALPERGIASIKTEGRQQVGMVFGAPGREHLEIALGEAFGRPLVDRIDRVHQAIAEGIGVDVERAVHEVRDIGPEGLVAGLELDRGTEALLLRLEPERVEALGGQLPAPAFGMDLALERIERNLAHHRIDHVLDLGGEHGLAL